jgi:Outer membrane lipoprotein carrier protein LolA
LKISRRRLIAGSVLLLASRDAGADGEARDLVARVGRARAGVRTMQGPFEQKRTIGLLATEVRSHGTLILVRPDSLRWDLAPPDDVTFWVGPEGLAYRSAHGHGRAPASSATIGGALEDLRTVLGGDLAKLRDRWELRVVGDDATGAELEATPRPGVVARLQRLRFSLAPDLIRPSRALLVETSRDHTTIDFGALVVNAQVDEALMRPPA